VTKKIKWGVLSTAKIGVEKVIPAMQNGNLSEIIGIASRNIEHATKIAQKLQIPKAYGSYEELLNDTNIDAVYIPLPNNLHIKWAIKALEAGKHVLCEKPIGLNVADAEKLMEVSKKFPKLKIMEAFMYRFHPQWDMVKNLVDNGVLGEIKTIHSFFSYYNIDPNNIRNKIEVGGGALMDIGCYCISFPRYIFNAEPVRVLGIMDRDKKMGIDILSSGILDFSNGVTSTFTCSTQLMPYQRVNILGTKGRIEIHIPVNAPPDKPTQIGLYTKEKEEIIEIDAVNQYTIQGDVFSKVIIEDSEIPITLQDTINNMQVIDAFVKSSTQNKWINY
jgi:predicted dehydrogenase